MIEKIINEIDEACRKWEDETRKNTQSTEEQKDFIIATVKDQVARLILLAETLRKTYHWTKGQKGWRSTVRIHDNLLAEAQAISGFLHLINLRDTVTDKIEYSYGINFNGLRVYPPATKGDEVYYICFFDKDYPTVTLCKDGKIFGVPMDVYKKDYKPVDFSE